MADKWQLERLSRVDPRHSRNGSSVNIIIHRTSAGSYFLSLKQSRKCSCLPQWANCHVLRHDIWTSPPLLAGVDGNYLDPLMKYYFLGILSKRKGGVNEEPQGRLCAIRMGQGKQTPGSGTNQINLSFKGQPGIRCWEMAPITVRYVSLAEMSRSVHQHI